VSEFGLFQLSVLLDLGVTQRMSHLSVGCEFLHKCVCQFVLPSTLNNHLFFAISSQW